MSTLATARTVPVYQKRASIHELVTKIISCQSINSLSETDLRLFKGAEEGDYVIVTEETIFHPQGGGQPSDNGQMKSERNHNASFEVKNVRKSTDNRIYHLGKFSDQAQSIQEGEVVIQKIDTAKRNYHSRYHTAGHVLGLAVRQLKDRIGSVSEVKANHAPGMACVEFRGLIAGEHKAIIQDTVNQLVQRNLSVNVDWWGEEKAKAQCVALPEGFAVPSDGNIRVVDIEGAGAYPCGGTHLPTTQDIGRIIVRKISRQKGITKVSYDVTDV
ncbi:hypothetical protein CNMCM8927_008608 [Aspergillus lentulus]|uniref:Alanyl-transfer RNA synthetases family profile domain-containing protein n=1 Tax=Aspergillus lentulus TaxID=293939 RepID=A0AAN5YM58_ASPLE|nr:hypothetical protein CNMCM8060_007380 [Aspergillus lentulus]KAF4194009.1 hypothetical protein CNMCM8694_008054 [Aspergillus lentulus]KAF4203561.1 hypothetical protein CNMCM8927_008608 [Aspergillus lentulus]